MSKYMPNLELEELAELMVGISAKANTIRCYGGYYSCEERESLEDELENDIKAAIQMIDDIRGE